MSLKNWVITAILALMSVVQGFCATVQLKTGWNLVPVPVEDGTSVSGWLQEKNLINLEDLSQSKLAKIWTYDDGWAQFVPGEDNTGSTRFEVFKTNRGYWFLMAQEGSFDFTERLNPVTLVRPSWNLVGFGNASSMEFKSQVLSAERIDSQHGPENVVKVWSYDANTTGVRWKDYSADSETPATSTMNPGQAHWFLVANANGKEVSQASPMTITPVGASGTAALVIGGATSLTPPGGGAAPRVRASFQTIGSASTGACMASTSGQYARAFDLQGNQLSSDAVSRVCFNGSATSYEVGFDSATKAYLSINADVANNLVIKVELDGGQSVRSVVVDEFRGKDLNTITRTADKTVNSTSTLAASLISLEMAKKLGVPQDKFRLGERNSGLGSVNTAINKIVKSKDVDLNSFNRLVTDSTTGTDSVFRSLIASINDFNSSGNVDTTSRIGDLLNGKIAGFDRNALDRAKKAASKGMELLASKARASEKASLSSSQAQKMEELTVGLFASTNNADSLLNIADLMARSVSMAEKTSGDAVIGGVVKDNLNKMFNRFSSESSIASFSESDALKMAAEAVAFPPALMADLSKNSGAAKEFAGLIGQSNVVLKKTEKADKDALAKLSKQAESLKQVQGLLNDLVRNSSDSEIANELLAEAVSASTELTEAADIVFSQLSAIRTELSTTSLTFDFGSLAQKSMANAADPARVAKFIAKNAGDASQAAKVLREVKGVLSSQAMDEVLQDQTLSSDFGLGSQVFADAGPDSALKYEGTSAPIVLDARASFDPQGRSNLTYTWYRVEEDGNKTSLGTEIVLTTDVINLSGTQNRNFRLEVSQNGTKLAEDEVTYTFFGALPPEVIVPPFLQVRVNQPVFIDGSFSFDPEGRDELLTYEWSDGSILGTSNVLELPDGFNTKGSKELVFKVSRSETNFATAAVRLQVNDGLPPVADAGYDFQVGSEEVAENLVFLDNYSFSRTGGQLQFNWEPRNLFVDATSEFPQLKTSVPGSYDIKLIVTEGSHRAEDTVTVRVRPGLPPVADAGYPILVQGTGSQTVNLDGSFSYSFSNSALTYSWSGPGTVNNADQAMASVQINPADFAERKVLKYSLKVQDSNGEATDTVEVVVVPPAATLPPVVIVDKFPLRPEYRGGEVVFLDASKSFNRGESRPLTFNWIPQGNYTLSSTTEAISAFTIPSGFSGVAKFEVTVSNGNRSSRQVVEIPVMSVNRPPVAQITPRRLYINGDSNGVSLDCFGSFGQGTNSALRCEWTLPSEVQIVSGNPLDANFLEVKAASNITTAAMLELKVIDTATGLSSRDSIPVFIEKSYDSENLPIELDVVLERQYLANGQEVPSMDAQGHFVFIDDALRPALNDLKIFGYSFDPNSQSQAPTVTAFLYPENGTPVPLTVNPVSSSDGLVDYSIEDTSTLDSGTATKWELRIGASTASQHVERKRIFKVIAPSSNTGLIARANIVFAEGEITPTPRLEKSFNQDFVTVEVDAAGSQSASGSPLDYQWEYSWKTSGVTSQVYMSGNFSPRVGLDIPLATTDRELEVQVVAVDPITTQSSTAKVTLKLKKSNSLPPVAMADIAGIPSFTDPNAPDRVYEFFLGANQEKVDVTLLGGLSYSPTGRPLAYEWKHDFAPVFEVSGNSTPMTTGVSAVAHLFPGEHRIVLTVRDGANQSQDAFRVRVIRQIDTSGLTYIVSGNADAFPRDAFMNQDVKVSYSHTLSSTSADISAAVSMLKREIEIQGRSEISMDNSRLSGFMTTTFSQPGTYIVTVKTWIDGNNNGVFDSGTDGSNLHIQSFPVRVKRELAVDYLYAFVESPFEVDASMASMVPVTFVLDGGMATNTSTGNFELPGGTRVEFYYTLRDSYTPTPEPGSQNNMQILSSTSSRAMTVLSIPGSGSFQLEGFAQLVDVATGVILNEAPLNFETSIQVIPNDLVLRVNLYDPRGEFGTSGRLSVWAFSSTTPAGFQFGSDAMAQPEPSSPGNFIFRLPLGVTRTSLEGMGITTLALQVDSVNNSKVLTQYRSLMSLPDKGEVDEYFDNSVSDSLAVSITLEVGTDLKPLPNGSYELRFFQDFGPGSQPQPLAVMLHTASGPLQQGTAPILVTTTTLSMPRSLEIPLSQVMAPNLTWTLRAELKGESAYDSPAVSMVTRFLYASTYQNHLYWHIDFRNSAPDVSLFTAGELMGRGFDLYTFNHPDSEARFEFSTGFSVDVLRHPQAPQTFDWDVQNGVLKFFEGENERSFVAIHKQANCFDGHFKLESTVTSIVLSEGNFSMKNASCEPTGPTTPATPPMMNADFRHPFTVAEVSLSTTGVVFGFNEAVQELSTADFTPVALSQADFSSVLSDEASYAPGRFLVFKDLDFARYSQVLRAFSIEPAPMTSGSGTGNPLAMALQSSLMELFSDAGMFNHLAELGVGGAATCQDQDCRTVEVAQVFPVGASMQEQFTFVFMPTLQSRGIPGTMEGPKNLKVNMISLAPPILLADLNGYFPLEESFKARYVEGDSESLDILPEGHITLNSADLTTIVSLISPSDTQFMGVALDTMTAISGARYEGQYVLNDDDFERKVRWHEREYDALSGTFSDDEMIEFGITGGNVFETGYVEDGEASVYKSRESTDTSPFRVVRPLLVDAGNLKKGILIGGNLVPGSSTSRFYVEEEDDGRISREREEITIEAFFPELSISFQGMTTTVQDVVVLREVLSSKQFMLTTGGEEVPTSWPGDYEINRILLGKGVGLVMSIEENLDASYDPNMGYMPHIESSVRMLRAFSRDSGTEYVPELTGVEAVSAQALVAQTVYAVMLDTRELGRMNFRFEGSGDASPVTITDYDMTELMDEGGQPVLKPTTMTEEALNWTLEGNEIQFVEGENPVARFHPILLPEVSGIQMAVRDPQSGEVQYWFSDEYHRDQFLISQLSKPMLRLNFASVVINATTTGTSYENQPSYGLQWSFQEGFVATAPMRIVVRGPGLPHEGIGLSRTDEGARFMKEANSSCFNFGLICTMTESGSNEFPMGSFDQNFRYDVELFDANSMPLGRHEVSLKAPMSMTNPMIMEPQGILVLNNNFILAMENSIKVYTSDLNDAGVYYSYESNTGGMIAERYLELTEDQASGSVFIPLPPLDAQGTPVEKVYLTIGGWKDGTRFETTYDIH